MRNFLKYSLFIVMLLSFSFSSLYATEIVKINNSSPTTTQVTLLSADNANTVVKFAVNAYELQQVSTPNGYAYTVNCEDGAPLQIKGAPDLAKISQSIIIPNTDRMEVKIVSSNYIEIPNFQLAPSKGNLLRTVNPANVPFEYGKEYSQNAFFPGKLADLNTPYILRDFRGQTINVYPFQYNPVTKVLRVYTDITVSVVPTGLTGVNTLNNSTSTINREFANIYSHQFLNFEETSRYTPVEEMGRMLIISHANYIDAIAPFVEWKTQEGIQVEVVDVATIGTTSAAIKTYITNYYNSNPDFAFLLFVGDAQHIPVVTSGVGGDSDNAYGYINGSDHYQEILIGRFSAESVAHVETQVLRSLEYEKYINQDASDWLATNMGIASDQGPGDDNEYDYAHIRNIQTDLIGFTYNTSLELFDGSQGGLDASGSPTPAMVTSGLNTGVGIITYTGHGSDNSFVTSGFSSSNIPSLNNVGKLPFIWSVACVNGNFVGQTCFAEAWMRAAKASGEPIGAVATFMSTINQSWNPPMAGEDEMADILVESYTNNIKRTFGGLSVNGCFLMNDEYGGEGDEMTDTWTLFGDPSLMVRTATPVNMTVAYDDIIFLGAEEFIVSCNMDGAVVALTLDNTILGVAVVENGEAVVTFEAIEDVAEIMVVVTGFNKIPHIGSILSTPASGPWVSLKTFLVNDANGNNNGLADYSETVGLNIGVKNNGVETALGVVATLTTTDPNVVIEEATYEIGDITADQLVEIANAFTFSIADDVTDQYELEFTVTFTDNTDNVWDRNITITANAPDFNAALNNIFDEGAISFVSSEITTARELQLYNYDVEVFLLAGNNNGSLDPAETVLIRYNVSNIGHALSPEVICTLSSTSEYVTISSSEDNIGEIASDGTGIAEFQFTVSENTPIGQVIEFTLTINYGSYSTEISNSMKVGLILEDFETGDFSSYDWTLGGDADFAITNSSPYEGTFSAVSGDVNDNGTSELIISMNVLSNDVISFYKKVSSENTYDYFRFFIDNTEVGSWSGDVAWSEETYDVTAGQHTFKWVYEKDYTVSSGADCAWLDYILLPPFASGKVFNGVNEVTIEAVELPNFLTFTNNGDGTANISGTPQLGNAGTYDISLKATSEGVEDVFQNFSLVVDVTNSIINNDLENAVSIYPNPTSGNAVMSFELVKSDVVTVEIFNILGEKVVNVLNKKQLSAGTQNINIVANELNAGVYFVKFTIGGNSVTKQIVITK